MVCHGREEVEPEPGHTQSEAEDNTSDSVCVPIGFRFSGYISRTRNDTDVGYREERINLIPELADYSTGNIAGIA
jgi:hypothetical protein